MLHTSRTKGNGCKRRADTTHEREDGLAEDEHGEKCRVN